MSATFNPSTLEPVNFKRPYYLEIRTEIDGLREELAELKAQAKKPFDLTRFHFARKRDPTYYHISSWNLHVNIIADAFACVGALISIILFLFGISIGPVSDWTILAAFIYAPLFYFATCVVLEIGRCFKIAHCYLGYIFGAVSTFFALIYFGCYFIVHPTFFSYLTTTNRFYFFNVEQDRHGGFMAAMCFIGALLVGLSIPIVKRAHCYAQEQAFATKPIKFKSSELIVKSIS